MLSAGWRIGTVLLGSPFALPSGALAQGGSAERDGDVRLNPPIEPLGSKEGSPPRPEPLAYERYIVQGDESMDDITERFGISRAELLATNRIDALHPLVRGRILRIARREPRAGNAGDEREEEVRDGARQRDSVVAPDGYGFYQV